MSCAICQAALLSGVDPDSFVCSCGSQEPAGIVMERDGYYIGETDFEAQDAIQRDAFEREIRMRCDAATARIQARYIPWWRCSFNGRNMRTNVRLARAEYAINRIADRLLDPWG